MGSVNQVRGGEAELDDRAQEVVGRNRDGIAGEGQGLSEEDESRVVEDGKEGVEVADAVLNLNLNLNQHQQQQQPGAVVCWERFLPVRSLKILLVENDDCTRQVVSALLRNCSYEVTATENGLEAWKILQDLTNHIDLVLTEVVMPCLSGIGLLCKIMSHKTLKNIPVIMMSSHDSMGIVFKCLSKGAVDFLVKPIRKNELRNLWQHVWRRCHSSSSSGSESGIPTQKSVKSKNVESDKDTSSSSEDDNASLGANVRDGSDNGSQTQSSWTKCAAEVESPKPMSPSGHLADPPDSTCAQVIHSKNEAFCNEWIPLAGSSGCGRKEILENGSTVKYLEIRLPRGSTKGCGSYPRDKVPYLSDKNIPTVEDNLMEESPLNDSKKHNHKSKGDILELNGSKVYNESSAMLPGMIGVVANDSNTQVLTKIAGPCGDTLKISTSKAKGQDDAKELPSLELSLKRSATTRDGGNVSSEDRKTLRHSDLSAFSRYNTSATSNQVATAFGGSYSFRLDNNSSEGPKTESLHIPQSASDTAGLNQGSNGSSNNIDMGSTTKNSPTVASISTEKPGIASVSKGARVSAFHSVPHRVSGTQEVLQEKIDKLSTNTVMVQPNGVHHQVQVQHHHHHYHHHHVQSMQLQQQLQHPPQNNEFAAKVTSSGALQCRSSNVLSGPMECNVANYSVNGSISGSNHGSSAAGNTRALNIEGDSGAGGNGGSGGCNGSGSGSRGDVDKIRFARREAALNKFRKKRKERCFEKKVRYQSRKRLAEQRPRLCGQFVRQATHEPKDDDADC